MYFWTILGYSTEKAKASTLWQLSEVGFWRQGAFLQLPKVNVVCTLLNRQTRLIAVFIRIIQLHCNCLHSISKLSQLYFTLFTCTQKKTRNNVLLIITNAIISNHISLDLIWGHLSGNYWEQKKQKLTSWTQETPQTAQQDHIKSCGMYVIKVCLRLSTV